MEEYLLEAQKFNQRAREPLARKRETRISTWPNGAFPAPSRKAGRSPRNTRGRRPSRTCAPGLIPIFLVMAGVVPATRGSLHSPWDRLATRGLCVPRPE